MKSAWQIGLLSILFVSVPGLAQDLTILVDYQPFSSVDKAASAENKIEWSGKDVAAMTVCTQSYAALELQQYLRQALHRPSFFSIQQLKKDVKAKSIVVTGLHHPSVLEIAGKYQLDTLLTAEESFAIIPDHDRLYIIGHDRVGTLYGVYHFLESMGFRWFAPGDLGMIAPPLQRIPMPAGPIFEKPAYVTRGFWAWEDRGCTEFYRWMARNRLNFWTIAEPNHALLKKLGIKLTAGGHVHFDRFLNPNEEYPFNYPRFQGDEHKPTDPDRADNAEYSGDVNGDNKLTYFEAHPEWYGLVNDRRETFKGDLGANICTSNRDAVAELSRKLVNDLTRGEWSDANSLNFWPLDVGAWCECMECKSLGTFTDRMLLLTHQVRQAIAKAESNGVINRTVQLIYPIYYETLPPPSRPLPPDFDNVNCIGTVFPIQRCYVHALDDPNCTEYNVKLWRDFSGWISQQTNYCRGQFFVGEYYNVSSIRCLPVIYPHIMAHDIPLYYRNGVRHCHYMHVCTKLLGQKRLNNYLFARLLWNPYSDVNSILADYYGRCYGPFSESMSRLYARLEYGLSNIKQLKHFRSLADQMNSNDSLLFPLDHLQLKEHHPIKNDGVDLEESVMALQDCRRIMDTILMQPSDDRMRRILAEDDRNLRYAENTVLLYYNIARSIVAKRAGDLAGAKEYYRLTIPLTVALEAEKEILQTSSSHANAKDGFEASLIKKVHQRLAKELQMTD